MAISEEHQTKDSHPAKDKAPDAVYSGILEEVQSWSEAWRFKLLHDLLDTLASDRSRAEKRKEAAEKIIGILAVEGKEPPTDEEVERILEDARMEKELGSRTNGNVEPTNVEQDENRRKLAERKARFDQAWGILRTDAPPPTDEEVERILEDARMEKYS
jgi:hypothetical protein